MPVTGGMSSGDGRKSTTASSSGCTPLFLNAEPQMTGTNAAFSLRTDSIVRLRSAALISLFGDLLAVQVLLEDRVVDFAHLFDELLAVLLGLRPSCRPGISSTT